MLRTPPVRQCGHWVQTAAQGPSQECPGGHGGHGLLPYPIGTVPVQERGAGLCGEPTVREAFHPDETGQGEDRQERRQGHLRVRPVERCSAVHRTYRCTGRVPATVKALGQLHQKEHRDKEQGPWGEGTGVPFQIGTEVPGQQPETSEKGDIGTGKKASGTGEGRPTAAVDTVAEHPWDRAQDRPVPDSDNRWVPKVRERFTAVQLCGHHAHHP